MSSDTAELTGAARNLSTTGLIAVAWSGFAVAASLVCLRCYARKTETGRLHPDDYWMLAALFFLCANAVLQTLQTDSLYYLVEVSTGSVPAGQALLDQGNTYVRFEFVVIALFWTVVWSVKASFLALYYRLFAGLPQHRRMWWAVVAFTALAYIGCWIASVWTCHPPSTYFKFGTCTKPADLRGSIISISYSTAVDIISNLMIMVLPVRLIRDLQMDKRQKIGLASIFGVGIIIIATAIVRCTQIVAYARSDPVGLAVWGLVESSISVMVGSLPVLRTMLSRTLHRTFGSSGMTSERGSRRRRRDWAGSERLDSEADSSFQSKAIPLQYKPRSELHEHFASKADGIRITREYEVASVH